MAVGTTRIHGRAGVEMNIVHYLAGDLSEEFERIPLSAGSWTYGTGANQVNCVYAANTTLADDGTDTINLYSGGLLDVFNRTITMSSLKFLYIKNNSTDATLEVLGTAVTGLDIVKDPTDIILVKPGGYFLWVDPSAAGTVMTTNLSLKLLHGGTGTSSMVVNVIAMGLD